jgi:frataxin-like iron-binding protein CyaY
MTDIVEIADHMINMVEDYAEIMGVEVIIETEIRNDILTITVQIMKGDN